MVIALLCRRHCLCNTEHRQYKCFLFPSVGHPLAGVSLLAYSETQNQWVVTPDAVPTPQCVPGRKSLDFVSLSQPGEKTPTAAQKRTPPLVVATRSLRTT